MISPARRREHYLRANDRSETIHQCVWYDCETRPVVGDDGATEHHLVFGWAAYRRRGRDGQWLTPQWHRFTSGEQLWRWIVKHTSDRKTLYVWAHNQSFDWQASDGMVQLRELGYSMTSAIVDSPPFIMQWRSDTRKICVTDTLNIWLMNLKSMGKLTGLAKLEMPATWSESASDDEYCRRDVEIIMYAICDWADFLVVNDLGKMQLTVASQAMQTFRHRYLTDNILIDNDERALSIARSSYRGGRVECFRIGTINGPLYLLDINSLYPYVMMSEEYPLRLVRTSEHITMEELTEILSQYCVCATVTVNLHEPCLALRDRHKLIFPTGRFRAHATSPELRYLIETKQLVSVEECAIYERGRPFVGFVNDLYARRIAHKSAGREIESEHYKKLLNSFSGKWGQNGRKWVDCGPVEHNNITFIRAIDADTDQVTEYRTFGGRLQRRETLPESLNSHPAIAAHFTAYGRMVLWALMREATREQYLYCDTDSILVTVEGLHHLNDRINDKSLGGLKLVGEFAHVTLYGCKDYILDGRRVCKGLRDSAVDLGDGSWRQTRWTSFRGALRRGTVARPVSQEIIKRLRRSYDKGIVRADGVVLPLHF